MSAWGARENGGRAAGAQAKGIMAELQLTRARTTVELADRRTNGAVKGRVHRDCFDLRAFGNRSVNLDGGKPRLHSPGSDAGTPLTPCRTRASFAYAPAPLAKSA
ncbi:hypothetical protein MPPM_2446 [Methylorubrum populi]|uniref:Uncharacterized protein n=1 Tax=Methylorubrum populi TaxID=223967 RepID=A0A160PGX4_9HYPH|nr:hypothetical protein MPPM_2446 [Methylorubrum populi]